MHPNAPNFKEFTDSQLEQKILKLNSIYFMAHDESVRHQIILLLDSYKIELEERRRVQRNKQNGDNDLDNLININ
jgi:hypothetical protein